MGGCFEKIQRTQDAIKSYERAIASNDQEGIALRQLAKLHDKEKNIDKAAYFFKAVLGFFFAYFPTDNFLIFFFFLDQLDAKGAENAVTVEALLYLAKHCIQKSFFKEAEKYCSRLLDFNVPEKEEAKTLLKQIHLKVHLQKDPLLSSFMDPK